MNKESIEYFRQLGRDLGKYLHATHIPQFIKTHSHCYCCGETDYPCLDFHHIDPKTKKYNMTVKTIGVDKMWEEVEKCEVVCSNYHRRIHHHNISVYDLADLFKEQREHRLEMSMYSDKPEGPHLTTE